MENYTCSSQNDIHVMLSNLISNVMEKVEVEMEINTLSSKNDVHVIMSNLISNVIEKVEVESNRTTISSSQCLGIHMIHENLGDGFLKAENLEVMQQNVCWKNINTSPQPDSYNNYVKDEKLDKKAVHFASPMITYQEYSISESTGSIFSTQDIEDGLLMGNAVFDNVSDTTFGGVESADNIPPDKTFQTVNDNNFSSEMECFDLSQVMNESKNNNKASDRINGHPKTEEENNNYGKEMQNQNQISEIRQEDTSHQTVEGNKMVCFDPFIDSSKRISNKNVCADENDLVKKSFNTVERDRTIHAVNIKTNENMEDEISAGENNEYIVSYASKHTYKSENQNVTCDKNIFLCEQPKEEKHDDCQQNNSLINFENSNEVILENLGNQDMLNENLHEKSSCTDFGTFPNAQILHQSAQLCFPISACCNIKTDRENAEEEPDCVCRNIMCDILDNICQNDGIKFKLESFNLTPSEINQSFKHCDVHDDENAVGKYDEKYEKIMINSGSQDEALQFITASQLYNSQCSQDSSELGQIVSNNEVLIEKEINCRPAAKRKDARSQNDKVFPKKICQRNNGDFNADEHTLPDKESAQTEIMYVEETSKEEPSLTGSSSPIVYSCDLDMCTTKETLLCQSVDEYSNYKDNSNADETMMPEETCNTEITSDCNNENKCFIEYSSSFPWKENLCFSPCDRVPDKQFLTLHENYDPGVITYNPPPVCSNPRRRLGLSKRQKVKKLHPAFQLPEC